MQEAPRHTGYRLHKQLVTRAPRSEFERRLQGMDTRTSPGGRRHRLDGEATRAAQRRAARALVERLGR